MTAILSKNLSAQQIRVIRDAQLVTVPVQTSTASYVDFAGSKVDAGNSSSLVMTLLNTHATLTIKWKVLASNDDVTYVEAQAEATVAANGAVGTFTTTQPIYRYYKMQILDGSGHATATGTVFTKD